MCAQSLSQKDWDGFVETYGLPPLFLELPPDIPAEREAEYQAQAEAIIGDARGTVPNGTKIHTGRFGRARAESVRGASAIPGPADRAGGDGRQADGADGIGFGDAGGRRAPAGVRRYHGGGGGAHLGDFPAAVSMVRLLAKFFPGSRSWLISSWRRRVRSIRGRDRSGAHARKGRLRDRSGGAFGEDGLTG